MNSLLHFLLLISVPFLLFSPANGQSAPKSRAKRFAGFGGPLSTVGGNFGCVVSQDKLYINGRFTKSLNEDEQEEMREYKQALDRFKADVKAFLEQQQKQLQLAESEVKAAFLQAKKQPEPPKRPSFCSEKATTQFVFDGCTVQGDSVFIGDSFVRKLTAEEQTELATFEQQFTAYQEALTAGFKKQMEQFFGRQFGPLFGGNSTTTAELAAAPSKEAAGSDSKSADAPTPPVEPKSPEFCTLVV